VVLRCRQLARERFAKLRSDVLVKLELLDQKHGEFLFSYSHAVQRRKPVLLGKYFLHCISAFPHDFGAVNIHWRLNPYKPAWTAW